jgi:hypothetical protein
MERGIHAASKQRILMGWAFPARYRNGPESGLKPALDHLRARALTKGALAVSPPNTFSLSVQSNDTILCPFTNSKFINHE